jgi:tRNA nucleotidyltransferase (CCA-adding enzyme)
VLITAFLARDPASLLTRLKCSTRDIERGRAIGAWRERWPDPRHAPAVRRWLAALGPQADDLLTLAAVVPGAPAGLARAVEAIRSAGDPLTLGALAVNGDDLLAAGVRPGPDVGETLEQLLADVLDDPARNTRAALLARVADRRRA